MIRPPSVWKTEYRSQTSGGRSRRAEAGQVRSDQARLAALLQQEGVVPVARSQVAVRHLAAGRLECPDDPLRLVRRVQPVRAEREHQEARLRPLERPFK